MSQFFQIHPDNPQARLIAQAAAIIRSGGVVIYPTDSCYALGCHLGDKAAVERIRQIRQLDQKHDFTLVCRDLSEVALYAQVDNAGYRLMKNLTPGPYTFILKATHEVPRRLMNPKRKAIGLRVPDNSIVADLLDSLGEPIMSTTLVLPDDEFPLIDPYDMRDTLGGLVDLIIDGGYCGLEPTTVVDLLGDSPKILRQGKGDVAWFVS